MPNRHGWTALIGAAASVVTGRLFGLIELYVIGAGMAATVCVSWAWVRRPLPRLEVRRRCRPAVVTAGHPARVELQVINQGRRPSPRLFLWEPVGARGGAPMQVGRLGAAETAAAAYRIPTQRRGVVTLGPLWVERRDPFGVATRATTVGGALDVLVLPTLLDIGAPSAGGSGTLGEHLRVKAMGQTGGEFHGLRSYQQGDDLRRINWKASARSTGLIVTEHEPDGLRRCTVVLDTSGFGAGVVAPGEIDEAFERAVSIAASVVHAASTARLHTRFRTHGAAIEGVDVEQATLRHLARVHPSDDGTLAPSTGASHDHLGLVVVVAAAPDRPAERAARADTGPTDTVITITTLVPPREGAFAIDGTTLDAFMAGWSSLVESRSARARPEVAWSTEAR
jgi:uncharacterized protein (DUF58 family)